VSDAQIDKFPAEYLGSDAHVRAMAERINRFAGQIVAAIAAGTIGSGGSAGTVDVYQVGTLVQPAAKFIRISATRDTSLVLEFVAATISGNAGVDIIMKAATTDKAALTYVNGLWGARLIQFP